ncbi:related to glycerol transporter [Cephalotrichum gorgonifer]|uniref:Related to glycerol transporter n=1 Tax=Cephalotrichum gorgonifer TaxID=2041049 RepID=A0AAE8MXL9_9PEZI|nr:related to glycerol transporter [Cephalotrichum gorgonifer]
MGLFSYIRSIYDVSVLDTRFVAPSTVPYTAVAEARDGTLTSKDPRAAVRATAEPSRWKRPEYIAYLLYLVWVIPTMFWIGYSVSRPSDPRYRKYESALWPGWIPGRKVDNTDHQYRTFRGNLPYMALLLVFHPLARRLWNSVYPARRQARPGSHASEAAARLDQRTSFDFAFALCFLVVLHGFSSLKVLLILYANYRLTTALPRRYVPVATWVFNVGILFANELCAGYHYKSIARLLTSDAGDFGAAGEPALVRWGAWLDSHGGLLGRWEVLFNITILRLISFNLDRYWATDDARTSALEKKQLDPSNPSERERVSMPADAADYSFRNYVAYAIYAPLYIAGPIMTFNDYISQSKYPSPTIETPRTVRYAIRFLLTLLAMEIVLHYVYIGAITLARPVWSSYTPSQLCLLAYFNLHIIWLKLLLPWRLFRLWALLDGLDPPENMVRCVSNNYSTQHFWRAWHRSYNRWLIRYIYGPLGGARFDSPRAAARSVMTYVLVFTFVALWHDIQMRLLIWGWLIVLLIVPEMVGRMLFPASRYRDRPGTYRLLCSVGGVWNVIMMMSANLVGFAVGLDGMKAIIAGIFKDYSGAVFLVVVCSTLLIFTQIMFEVRETEKRSGAQTRC